MTDEPTRQEEAEVVEESSGAEERAAALEDRLLRLAADFDNYKKRAAREREEYVTHANERLVKELLPILDDLERALTAAAEHEGAALEEGEGLGLRARAGPAPSRPSSGGGLSSRARPRGSSPRTCPRRCSRSRRRPTRAPSSTWC